MAENPVDVIVDYSGIGMDNYPVVLQIRSGISLFFIGAHYVIRNLAPDNATNGSRATLIVVDGTNNKSSTIKGVYTLEVDENIITEDWTTPGQTFGGIAMYGVPDYVITGGTFLNFTSAAVYVSNNRAHNPYGNMGVIHHNVFDNPYKDNYFNRTGKYAIGGYGIIVGGDYSTDPALWVPYGELFGKYRPNTAFIEDNNFRRCRHCVAESDECGFYVFRHNYLTEMINANLGSYIDVHPGGRGAEIYANHIVNSPIDARSNPAYTGYYGAGVTGYGGSLLVYDNTWENFPQTNIVQLANTVTSIPNHKRVTGVWMWNNHYVNAGTYELAVPNPLPEPWAIMPNEDYFMREPTQAQDGFTYSAYPYPHPLTIDTNMGQMKGVLVKGVPDGDSWDNIATMCSKYGLNWLVLETCGTYFARYPSTVVPQWEVNKGDQLAQGIATAHAKGMKFSLMMLFGFRPTWQAPDPAYNVTQNDGTLYGWLCFTKQASKALVKNIVEEIATKYPDLDDFMFDYIRYEWWGQCYCEECHQRFMQDTGLTDVVWRTDVIDTGRYFNQFLDWRKTVVTEMVQNVRTWMKAINPKLTFSAAVMTAFQNTPYWVQWVGQDTPTYVDNGYLESASNMAYTPNLTDLADYINSSKNLYTRGKIPLLPYVGGLEGETTDMTTQQFADVMKTSLSLAPDGFVIYRYTGAGFEEYLKAAFGTSPTFNWLPIGLGLIGLGAIVYWRVKK